MKPPGIVIFTAILNFLSAGVFAFAAVISLLVLLFRNLFGVYDYMAREYPQMTSLSFGLNFTFGILLIVSLIFMGLFILLGMGLLQGKKAAWYAQVVLSIIGLLGFPIALSVTGFLGFPVGTVIHAVILFIFFRPSIRGYFGV
ncbi:MAG: hypothetical protein HY592_03595 [Candidatus Omnitrophica bacterium]|nr:hypothetical protein [Candidatus Omnitrophota bacterium]